MVSLQFWWQIPSEDLFSKSTQDYTFISVILKLSFAHKNGHKFIFLKFVVFSS